MLIVAATTALYRLAPPSYLAAYTFFLKQGARLEVDALRAQLALAGYQHMTQVVAPGEFSIRGGLIDLYPMGSVLPYRIDLFGEDIESIKSFDVDTQRTLYPVPEIRLLPAREFPLDDAARTRFRGRYREAFEGDPSKSSLYKDVSSGVAPGGLEYYLPLFFDATATIKDYLPAETAIALHGDVPAAIERFWQDTEARYRLLRGDKARPLLPPADLFLPTEEFFGLIKPLARVDIAAGAEGEPGPAQPLPSVQVDRRAEDPLAALKRFMAATDARVLVCAESAGRRDTMQQYFAEYGLDVPLHEDWAALAAEGGAAGAALIVSPLHSGFTFPAARLAFVTEAELYAGVVRRGRRDAARRSNVDAMLRDLSEVRIGDPVVHEQHGIGRYLGLVTLDAGEGPAEFLQLLYANDAKLYVPVSNLHVIGRYSGASPEAAPLHELGGGQWEKAKRRAARQAHDTAAELLNLYAQRALRKGHAFKFKLHDYEAFADGFPFEETPDQKAAIEAVIADLTSGQPMDRLVCGDVGFGKTEVALRAAWVALADGKQVAVLVPTTLLAEQHFQVFSDRFAELPVKLAELSRFRSPKEVKAALDGLAAGTIDLVIGTHKLIQPDVKFRNLGLVIIDEEHRFGVRQKEQLKRLRAEVDVLTLTATPIPRTLAMSLEGIRDFSVIATAPQRRLAIKTFVAVHSAGVIREAALRELKRGGQIYFLHNDIDTINTTAERLAKLLPEARIAVAHGQMGERDLEHVMREFYAQRSNLLVCSTIIETGIDVPTANTIIIERADRFGLAQLHQLRGRVGRSHHQAYAYLLTPPEEALSALAKKRLDAITDDGGPGRGLLPRDARPRDPRRRRSAGRVAVGRDAGGGLPALRRHAARRRVVAEGRARARPRGAAGRRHRDQPARAGAAAGDLLQRHPRAAGALQAARQLRDRRRARRDAGGARRPLRQPARARAGAARLPSPARDRQAAGHRQDRRGAGALAAAVHEGSADRRRPADPAGAEGRAHPLRRPRQGPHRARRADARRAHRAAARLPEAVVSSPAASPSRRRAGVRRAHAVFRAAAARVRPRLAVGEQRRAEEPRRPRADRHRLRAPRAADAGAARHAAGSRRRAARPDRQHALPLGPHRRQRGARAEIPLPDRDPGGRAPGDRRLGRGGAAARLADQTAERFQPDETLAAGRSYVWGDLEWQALAAPGHDRAALVFYNPEHRILVSGDALWEHGFGFLMPPEIDPGALPETRATIEMLSRLDLAVVIPGHGEPFTDAGRALERAMQRVVAFEQEPLRMARHAVKVVFAFGLLDRQRMRIDELPAYFERVGIYRDFNRRFFGLPAPRFAEWLVTSLEDVGAVRREDGWLLPA